jgi:hypothetical protein
MLGCIKVLLTIFIITKDSLSNRVFNHPSNRVTRMGIHEANKHLTVEVTYSRCKYYEGTWEVVGKDEGHNGLSSRHQVQA